MTFLTVQFGEVFRWEGLGLDILGAGLSCMRRALPEFLAHPKNKMSSSCAASCSADEERPLPPPLVGAGGGGDAATAKEEYDFIEQPSQEYFCPVTFELLLHPDQTTCCGHHISREAVVRIQKDKKPCPMCKANLTIVPDKFFRRKVHELKVRCSHKEGGCEWVGDLGSYDDHVNKCPKRPWSCEFCDFKSTYDIGNDHLPNCEKRPVPCPNACEISTIPFSDVESHLLECPLQLVACELAHAGCSVLVARRDLPLHMKESVQQHLLSASLLNLQLTRDKIERQDQELKKKDEQITLKDQHISEKEKELKKSQRDLIESDLKYAEMLKEKDLKYTEMVSEKEQQLARKEKEHTDILKERMAEKDCQIAKLQKQIGDGIVSLQQKFEKHAHATETNFVMQNDFRDDLHFVLRFVKHEFILTDFNKRKEGRKVRLKVLNQRGSHAHHIANAKLSFVKSYDRYVIISSPLLRFSGLQYDAAKDCEYLKDDCLKFELCIKAIGSK